MDKCAKGGELMVKLSATWHVVLEIPKYDDQISTFAHDLAHDDNSIEDRTLISWVSLGGHRRLMTSYQIKFIGTLGFTCQDVDTGIMLII